MSGAVWAHVVPALLVHRAHVAVAPAEPREGTIAARAGVRAPALLGRLHHVHSLKVARLEKEVPRGRAQVDGAKVRSLSQLECCKSAAGKSNGRE